MPKTMTSNDDDREAHMARLREQIAWLYARPRRNWLARLWNVSMFKLSAYLRAQPLDPHFIAKGLEAELRAMQDPEYQSATRVIAAPDYVFTYVDKNDRQIVVPVTRLEGPLLPIAYQKPRRRPAFRNARTFLPRGEAAAEDRPAWVPEGHP
jgi:hypothetical protein